MTSEQIAAIVDAIIPMTRVAQRTTLAANLETARTEHVTEHLLTGIHAGLWGAIAGAGIGDNDERQPVDVPGLPPVEKCPYCDQCRPMGLRGCLGHYPSGAGIGSDDE